MRRTAKLASQALEIATQVAPGAAQAVAQGVIVQFRYGPERVDSVHEQDFGLVDIADPGDQLLRHQRLADRQLAMAAQPAQRLFFVEALRQQIRPQAGQDIGLRWIRVVLFSSISFGLKQTRSCVSKRSARAARCAGFRQRSPRG